MTLLGLPIALAIAVVIAPAGLASLSAGGWQRTNYRGALLPLPAAMLAVAATLLSFIVLGALRGLGGPDWLHPAAGVVAVYALGVAFLGLVDDLLDAPDRGWRGHGAAVLRGSLSTGALKAAGALGLACLALSALGLSAGRFLLAVAVVIVATNVFNLLDLRPGRAVKSFVVVGIVVSIAAGSLEGLRALAPWVGPLLVLGAYDLRERAMLGDTGSNLLGGLAGLWIVLSLGTVGQIVALALLVAITVFGEFRSISQSVESLPPLRALDSLGRPG